MGIGGFGKVVSLKRLKGGSKISSFDYTFDNVGNRTRITEAPEAGESSGDYTDFTYDGSYRLRTETRKNSSGSRIYAYEYQYDESDNRTAKILTNSAVGSPKTYTYLYGDNNMLNSVGGAVSGTFHYDPYGNQTSRSIGGWTYGYDSRNQMTSATKTGTSISIKYDPLGRRIERVGPSGTTRYIYNGDNMIAEADGTNAITAWYTPGICETRKEGALWNTYYYACDGLGSTRELTNDKQQVTDAHAYNAWGEEQGERRPDTDPNKPKNPLRFVGKSGYYSDDDLGLDLLGARYYDPLIGRFVTQDPDRDGMNWYAYAGNNPVNAVDPMGEKPVPLNYTQKQYVLKTIELFFTMGSIQSRGRGRWTSVGTGLYDLYSAGKITFNSDLQAGAKFTILGGAHIELGESGFSGLGINDYDSIANLSVDMLHEYTHSTQSASYKILHPNGCELDAYQNEQDWLGSLSICTKYGLIGYSSFGVSSSSSVMNTAHQLKILNNIAELSLDNASNQLWGSNYRKLIPAVMF